MLSIPPAFNKIAIVGEALGEEEEKTGSPFVGASGQELTRMLAAAGIDRDRCYITNVFPFRPPGNNISLLCCKKPDLPVGVSYVLPPLGQHGYVRPEHLHHLDTLNENLLIIKPNVIIALGGTASWALCENAAISTIRGTVVPSAFTPFKVLPTYHPAAVLRAWNLRPIVIADFLKAAKQSLFPEIKNPSRTIMIEPDLSDLHSLTPTLLSAPFLSFDIETIRNKFISCISISPSPDFSLVLPFIDERKPGAHYWPTLQDELSAWEWLHEILSSSVPKIAQNGLYDIQYLLSHTIATSKFLHDTMLLHHSLYPELEKSLAFLGSIYTNEQPWKIMRSTDTEKRDDL